MTNSECQPILQKLEAWAFTSSSIHGDANSQSYCFFEAPNTGFFQRKCVCCWQTLNKKSKSETSTHRLDLLWVCLKTEAVMVPRRNSLRLWISWRTLPGVTKGETFRVSESSWSWLVKSWKLVNSRPVFLVGRKESPSTVDRDLRIEMRYFVKR